MINKNKELDVIRVWYCENCEAYEIDFSQDKVFCRRCGHKLKARVYKEVRE